jgi:hypothetical protein
MVLFSSATRVLFTTAAVLAAGGRLTGAGCITLRDIKFVELQEKHVTTMQIKVIGFFIRKILALISLTKFNGL